MRKRFINKLLLVPIFVALFSCEKLEEVGPDLCPSDDFSFTDNDLKIDVLSVAGNTRVETPLTSVNSTVDLDGEGLHVYAGLGQKIKWELVIKMKDGSAEKVYTDESDTVDVFWYGNSSKMPLFSAGDAEITFKILCLEDIVKTVKLENTPTFKDLDTRFGLLFRDWDQNGVFPIGTIGTADFTFGTGDGFFYGLGDAVADYQNTDPSPAGGYYINLYDKKSSKVWYYFATGINDSDFGDMLDSLPTSNTNELWFNIYVKGNQEFKNTSAEIVFNMSDGNYLYSEHVNWEGWKLISVPLSEFKAGTEKIIGSIYRFSFTY